MTPPSAAKLALVREKIESSFPQSDPMADAISVPSAAPEPDEAPAEEPKPPLDLGDLTKPLILKNYAEIAPQGSAHMIELAAALEGKGEFQRALLAWERVIDLTKPDDSQAAMAISAIKRLRPTLPDWNAKPEATIKISLHAGTGKKLAKTLTPILESAARDLELASSGLIKVKATVTAGKTSIAAKGPVPVALWLAGSDPKSASTDVLSFTVDSPDTLREDILKTVFLLVRSQLGRTGIYTPPSSLADKENPQDALNSRVTRLCWSEFATALNLPPKKGE